jgi:predicted nucleic acid-binding protein
MKPTVVLDTNILLDIFYFADPSVSALNQALLAGELRAVMHPLIWEEFEEVLARKPFAQNPLEIEALRIHQTLFIWQEITAPPCGVRCIDPDDQLFVELSVQEAPCLLITKDTDLLRLSKRLQPFQVYILQRFPDQSQNPSRF